MVILSNGKNRCGRPGTRAREAPALIQLTGGQVKLRYRNSGLRAAAAAAVDEEPLRLLLHLLKGENGKMENSVERCGRDVNNLTLSPGIEQEVGLRRDRGG